MRKIEKQMVAAVNAQRDWRSGNTRVENVRGNMAVYLHDNHIASFPKNGRATINTDTLREWPTPTTKSRLRALGFDVTTKNRVTYLNGGEV
jgi:hypothetical protein